jgi:hypothetical protein
MELGPYLNAHAFLRVERPPALWEADADDEPVLRMVGEMIAAALARGAELSAIVLRANNVTVESDEGDRPPAVGDYVVLSVLAEGDWLPECVWSPQAASTTTLVNADLDAAARGAGVRYAYTRQENLIGSVTVFLPRLPRPRLAT